MSLTPGQRATTKVLLAALGLLILIGFGLLLWEVWAATLNDEALITTVVRLGWEREPGAFWTVSVLTSFGSGVLGGHFFWCKRGRPCP